MLRKNSPKSNHRRQAQSVQYTSMLLISQDLKNCLRFFFYPPFSKGGARGDFTKMNGRERLSMKSPLPLFAKEGLNFINHWDRVRHV